LDRDAIRTRRAIAALGAVIAIVVLALLIRGCSSSSQSSALKDYNTNVATVMAQSNATGAQLFDDLSNANTLGATELQNRVNELRIMAQSQLNTAKGFSVPSQVSAAHENVLLALQLRHDGIASLATQLQTALGTATSHDAVNSMAAAIARFYASDVLYKDYAAAQIASALHAANVPIGGVNGVNIYGGQFLPDIRWLTPSFVARRLHVPYQSGTTAPLAPGTHGHVLNSVSVAGTTLQTGSTNTVSASPPPTFTLHFTNDGQNPETNVVLKITVSGTSISGRTVVPKTTPGESTSGNVTLTGSPPTGTNLTVTATVEGVPGEKNIANNTLAFPVTFQ
jgi:hypothetical protein